MNMGGGEKMEEGQYDTAGDTEGSKNKECMLHCACGCRLDGKGTEARRSAQLLVGKGRKQSGGRSWPVGKGMEVKWRQRAGTNLSANTQALSYSQTSVSFVVTRPTWDTFMNVGVRRWSEGNGTKRWEAKEAHSLVSDSI